MQILKYRGYKAEKDDETNFLANIGLYTALYCYIGDAHACNSTWTGPMLNMEPERCDVKHLSWNTCSSF